MIEDIINLNLHVKNMSDRETLWIVAEEITESESIEGSREAKDIGGGFGSRGGISEKVTSIFKKRVPFPVPKT